jgi:hypothetical protein
MAFVCAAVGEQYNLLARLKGRRGHVARGASARSLALLSTLPRPSRAPLAAASRLAMMSSQASCDGFVRLVSAGSEGHNADV